MVFEKCKVKYIFINKIIYKIKKTLFTEEIKEYDNWNKISMSKKDDSKPFSEINLQASKDNHISYVNSSVDNIHLSTIKNILKYRRKYKAS